MKYSRLRLYRWSNLGVCGAALCGLVGCLGPNPGFFISTTVANTTIARLVNTVLDNLLSLGGG